MIKVDDHLKGILQRDPFTGDQVIMELYKEIAIQWVHLQAMGLRWRLLWDIFSGPQVSGTFCVALHTFTIVRDISGDSQWIIQRWAETSNTWQSSASAHTHALHSIMVASARLGDHQERPSAPANSVQELHNGEVSSSTLNYNYNQSLTS